jgi:serine/tyrosine/threonine adenylyltransferase
MHGMLLEFDNRFVRELPGETAPPPGVRQVEGALWSKVTPTPVRAPRLLAWSPELAGLLGIGVHDVDEPGFAQVFSGNRLLPGMFPYAANYGGHQFGHWAGQLGDGRAIGLGEAIDLEGGRWELQLKGAGPTPYSRHADGRAVLRSSIREFLCSEAMHHLGIPTTRALCLVATGDQVERDMFYDGHPRMEPGAVVCRAAPSFLRFGSFELPFVRGDTELLRTLADFCIARDFPELQGQGGALYADWFGEVCERTAVLVGHWMRVGFVHGVLNTDNMSILGLTIDYGPYGWLEDYDPDWTPNTTDAQGRRYRFGWQPRIAGWNLVRLAHALSPLFPDPAPLQDGLRRFELAWAAAERGNAAAKLGLEHCREGDLELMRDLLPLLQAGEVDMTLWFRALSDAPVDNDSLEPFFHAFYDDDKRDRAGLGLLDWLRRRDARLLDDGLSPQARRSRMRAANPKYVLRNWLAQQAIDRAEAGDLSELHALQDVLRRPYEEQPGREAYAARRPEWARERAGCSMLSCSS